MQHVGVREDHVRRAGGSARDARSRCRRRRSPAGARQAAARRGTAPDPGSAPSSGRGRAPATVGSRAIASSTGRLNASDLPDAVPVVTITFSPRAAASQVSACWAKSPSMPRRRERRRDAGVEAVRQALEPRRARRLGRAERELLSREQVVPGAASRAADTGRTPARNRPLPWAPTIVSRGLAAVEQDHGRDREDAVARRRAEIRVDVELDEPQAAAGSVRDLAPARARSPCTAGTRAPELDDHGHLARQHLVVERRVRDLGGPLIPRA